jgi:hypothetical protein
VKITLQVSSDIKDDKSVHRLLPAEFCSLNQLAGDWYAINSQRIHRFVTEVNKKNEPDTLHPVPLSAVPCRFFRKQAYLEDPAMLEDFKRTLFKFIGINRSRIKAPRILVDFNVWRSPVPRIFTIAAEEAFQQWASDSMIEEVVIVVTKPQLVADCPCCGLPGVTFDLRAALNVEVRHEWQQIYEAICVCRHCQRATTFMLAARSPHACDFIKKVGGLVNLGATANHYVDVDRHVV